MSNKPMFTEGPWRQSRPTGFGTIYIDAPIGGGALQEIASIGPTDANGQ